MTASITDPGVWPAMRAKAAALLDPRSRATGLSQLNAALAVAILAAVATTVLETEPTISAGREGLFRLAELVFCAIFLAEYLARVWVAAEHGGWGARLRWMVSPAALVDLGAILPALVAPNLGPLYLLRLLRLVLIFRLAKLGRFSAAWRLVSDALAARRMELLLSLYAAIFLMLVSASLLFLVEGQAQPEKFGSIPRALWWSVVTLTTIGYGDVSPVTALGKAIAGVTAILGIGLIAAPTGILAAAFSDALARRRADLPSPK